MLNGYRNKQLFLLGEHLGHSFSPEIHAKLADYAYSLAEVEREAFPAYLAARDFDGLNVTIPYKTAVMPYLDGVSENAARIGAVNTVVKRDGRLYGYNTDYDGFSYLLKESGASVTDKKVLVLGSGGASKTVVTVLKDLGAYPVVISRSGEENYKNLYRHTDAAVLVNTTPVGMYPDNGEAPLSLSELPGVTCVIDLIYNPEKTALLLAAEGKGLLAFNGLLMLVAQAKRAAELFTGEALPDTVIREIAEAVNKRRRNIVLIGMPGCGKTTVGRILAERLSRPLYDTDAIVMARTGKNIPDIFKAEGEGAFRTYETRAASTAGRETGAVIATGGGIVLREENLPLLKQNGVLVFLKRPIRSLATAGRPLSDPAKMEEMYAVRRPLYEAFSDYAIDMTETAEDTADKIMEALQL